MNGSKSPSSTQKPVYAGGDAIKCGACGKPGDPNRRFCGSCGARLWEPCPDCGRANATDERFCGGCGVSLEESVARAVAAAVRTLRSAEELAQVGRFLDADTLLQQMALAEHSRLEQYTRRAEESRARFESQREDALASSHGVLAEVKQLTAGVRYREALARARTVPEALRGNEFRALYEEVDEKVKQADSLRVELKKGLDENRLDGLLSVAERLLELEPAVEKVRTIADRLRQRAAQGERALAGKMIAAAKQALAACDYRRAKTAIDRVPAVDELDEQQAAALKSVKERAWLAFQVARAPYLDEATLALADRFVKLQPQDEKAVVARDRMRKKWKESLKQAPGQPAVWSKAGGTGAVSPLPELAPTPRELAEATAGKPIEPSQFTTAYGLALQAAGLGRFSLDLAPQGGGWKSMLAFGGGPKRGADCWGVDIGSHSLKAVCFAAGEKGGRPKIKDVVYLPYERGAEAVQSKEAAVELPDYAKPAIEKLAEQHAIAEGAVVVGAPGTLTLARFFELPYVSKTKFEEALKYEARMRVPLDPETLVFDHSATDVPGKEGVKRVSLIASSRDHLKESVGALRAVGCKKVTATSHCLALLNAYHESYESHRARKEPSAGAPAAAGENATDASPDAATPAGDAPVVAYVSIGAKTTNFVVRHEDNYWFRGLYYGSDGFDRKLIRKLQHGANTVEPIRRKPAKAAWAHEIDETLQPGFAELGELIERTLAQYRTEEGKAVDRLLIGGGGAQQFGLIASLRAR